MQEIIKTKFITLCRYVNYLPKSILFCILHRVNMRRCIVCDTPISSNTPMESVLAECRRACCTQPCIHGWLESQNQNLCPVCKSVVGGNRFAPIFGSANNIDDTRNNLPSADQRTEAPGDNSGLTCTLGLYWTYIILFIIVLAILCVVSFIF